MDIEAAEAPRWPQLKALLEARLSTQAAATWLGQMRCIKEKGAVLTIAFPDLFSLNWVKDHYFDIIEAESRTLGSLDFQFVIDETLFTADKSGASDSAEAIAPPPTPPRGPTLNLNPRYVFSNYIIGPSNELASSAARTVAENDSATWNPLLLVGGVGLGKTHLLHAIGHFVRKRRPDARIQLKTSEAFINDVVQGIRTQTMEPVRDKYRSCDYLLIDDIQFIAKKEACQEEFFHTFNALYDAQKQIVVTSDRLPHEIPDIQERIKSRFAWGLIADLKTPELETRAAIVRKKAEVEKIPIEEDVAVFLARSVRSNMRELEGALLRLHAFASLKNEALSVSLAKEALKGIISNKGQALTCEQIIKTVAQYFDIKVAELKSTKRSRKIAYPRQVSMYLCRRHTGSSYPEIGSSLGGKDHTTALHAFNKISGRLTDPEVHGHIEQLERLLLD